MIPILKHAYINYVDSQWPGWQDGLAYWSRHLLLAWQLPLPGPMWWKESTDSWELSSDLCMCATARVITHTHIHTDNIRGDLNLIFLWIFCLLFFCFKLSWVSIGYFKNLAETCKLATMNMFLTYWLAMVTQQLVITERKDRMWIVTFLKTGFFMWLWLS